MDAGPERSLDPEDWDTARALAHRMIDDAIDHLATLRDRPAWQAMPPEVRAALAAPLPPAPQSAAAVYDDFRTLVRPYAMGNVHPRFWAWYMGGSNLTGALADFLAAIDGSNLGGGNAAPPQVERQVIGWLRDLMGFPASASGTLTSGGSIANLVGHAVMRNSRAARHGIDIRRRGVAALPRPWRVYASDQVHSCHQKALEILGLGAETLVLVPSAPDFTLDLAALTRTIAQDRARGLEPAMVIGSAGTVNTGTIDDLSALADLCAAEDLWFHVDGCIGAVLRLSPDHRAQVRGIERADSLALDPHKWLHAPFEAGCALIRDAQAHRTTFTLHPEYLEEKPRGVAAAEYLFDYGIDLSRGFKALKVWMALKEFGPARYGALIAQGIAQIHHLERRIATEPELELMSPVTLNILTFRYRQPGWDEARIKAVNTEIMLRLQESGIAIPSDTTLRGHYALRVANVNHRTRRADMDLLADEVLRLGRALAQG